MITINDRQMLIMDLDLQWNKYCKENGIEDPFEISRKLFSKHCRIEGTDLIIDMKDDPEEPSKLTRQQYREMRDKFLAARAYERIDYDAFAFKAKDYPELLRSPDYRPCGAADGQCRFECPIFFDCVKGDK
jgi:hypothetical protein